MPPHVPNFRLESSKLSGTPDPKQYFAMRELYTDNRNSYDSMTIFYNLKTFAIPNIHPIRHYD